MAGDYGSPYRAPCNPGNPGNWPPRKPPGPGCYNHRKLAAENVPAFANTTKVDDWRDPTDPNYQAGGIPPYPRKSDAGCDNTDCGRDTCTDPPWPDGGDCPGVCGSPCNPEATFQQLCDSWFTGVSPGGPPGPGLRTCGGTTVDFNCYQRVTITSATNSGPDVIIVTGVPHDLQTGQTVRVTNVPGVTGSYAVTVTNATTFTIVAHATGSYTGSGFVNLDLSVCRKVGFKNAQARKAWHGLFGWNSQFNCIGYELSFPGDDCGSGCNCTWSPYQGTPDLNKYCDWECNASTTDTVSGSVTSFATLDRKVSVGKQTGCQSVTACSDTYSDLGTFTALQNALTGASTVDPCTLGIASHLPPSGAFTLENMLAFFRPVAALFASSGTIPCGSTVTCHRTGCEPTYLCQAHDTGSGDLIFQLQVDATASPAYGHYQSWAIGGDPTCEILIQVSETVSHFKATAYGTPFTTNFSVFEVTNTLSNIYSSDDLYADLITLLNRIDISDDIRYPWRTDGYISIAPFVTYDENVPTSPNVSTAVATMCPISPTSCPYTGSIIGDLLPSGYGPHFDWNHRSWRSCRSGGPNDPQHYTYAYGAWAKTPPPSPVPPYTFTSCPPSICTGGTLPIVSFRSSGGILFFSTASTIPGWTGTEPVAICGTNTIDGIYNISGPTGTGPYEYSVIAPQINNAPFQTGCAGGVVGVVNVNTDATFYTVGDITDLAMPQTATQWTENWGSPLAAGDMPPGAWLMLVQGSYLYGQKWAEIKVHRPSYNFARPCGVDKWMLDESKVTCVESSDGLVPPTLTIYADIGLATNDLVYVCGVDGPPGVDAGVYKVTRLSATTVKLTTDCTMRRIASATQSGPNVNIVLTDAMNTINSGDSVDLVGVPGLGAGLTVTVTDTTHFSVPGTLSGTYPGGGFAFVSGSNAFQIAPNTLDFNCSGSPDANGIIGKIRFSSVPGICGRLGIASATQNGSDVIIVTGSPHYLAQGESVDFTGVGGLGSGLTVTVINSTSFQVAGTLSGPYVSGGFVNVDGAAAYQWNDDQSKGNFLFANFEFNFRDYAQADFMCEQYHGGSYSVCGVDQTGCNECSAASPGFTCVEVSPGVWQSDVRQTQLANGLDRAITNFTIDELCLPFDNCNPQIMAIVPSSGPEIFAQPSHVEHFPASFVSDWQYGSKWQAVYIQYRTDLLWQQPHKACITCDCDGCPQPFIPSGCAQQEDDGSCETDTCTEECTTHNGTTFYAHAPVVEALSDIPPGAPTPPVGEMHVLTYAEVSNPSPPPGILILPPLGPGYGANPGVGGVDPTIPVVPETSWGLFINEALCICSNGRFKQEYIENGNFIFCPP